MNLILIISLEEYLNTAFLIKMNKQKREGRKKDVTNEIVTREYTVNLHKRIHGVLVLIII